MYVCMYVCMNVCNYLFITIYTAVLLDSNPGISGSAGVLECFFVGESHCLLGVFHFCMHKNATR